MPVTSDKNFPTEGGASNIKVKALPKRRSLVPTPGLQSGKPPDFRQRYAQTEAERDALMQRLHGLGEPARNHPSYRRILRLLSATFRKASLAQRAAVLQTASWMIDVLERITFFI